MPKKFKINMDKPKLNNNEIQHIRHHINNQLTIILGSAELMKRESLKENKKAVEAIITGAKRIAEYINGLSDIDSN